MLSLISGMAQRRLLTTATTPIRLSTGQKLGLGAAFVAVVVGLLALSRTGGGPPMAVLYADLDGVDLAGVEELLFRDPEAFAEFRSAVRNPETVRAMLGAKARPVGWLERRARIAEVGGAWPLADDIALARRMAEAFAMAVRMTALAAVALVVAVPAWASLAAGGTFVDAVSGAARAATSVAVLAALAGLVLASWAISFVGYSAASGGIFGVLADGVRGRRIVRWRSMFRAVGRRFPDAVAVRFLTSCVNVTLVVVGVGTLFAAAQLARGAAELTGSSVVAPAATWALAGALYIVSAGLVRLTTEMVAAPLFLTDRGLGAAILDAAATVVSRPVLCYRLFVQSAAVLIAPLFLYWVALFGQQLSLGIAGLSAVGQLIVLIADIVLLAGIAGFAVMLQANFFAYYGWSSDLLVLTQNEDEPKKARRRVRKGRRDDAPTLDGILPTQWPHVVDLDEILDSADRSKDDHSEEVTEK